MGDTEEKFHKERCEKISVVPEIVEAAMLMFFYLPLVMFQGMLTAFEAQASLATPPPVPRKPGKPTVIMMP